MSALYDNPRDGVTLIAAECGFGKSALVVEAAARRAKKPYADENALGARAPLGSKTAISVLTNALAVQYREQFADQETQALRRFGPLSLHDAAGQPVCKLHDVAAPLVSGGHSVQFLFCEGAGGEKCRYYEGCKARPGAEGDPKARVVMGPHALLTTLMADAGSTGHLVIDEPSAVLSSTQFTESMLSAALGASRHFVTAYEAAMQPALVAAQHWLSIAPLDEPRPLEEVMRALSDEPAVASSLERAHQVALVEGDIVACVRGYQMPKAHHGSEPQRAHGQRDRARLGGVQAALRALEGASALVGARHAYSWQTNNDDHRRGCPVGNGCQQGRRDHRARRERGTDRTANRQAHRL
jgi:hypothetical protein